VSLGLQWVWSKWDKQDAQAWLDEGLGSISGPQAGAA
jgi:hypothetical protein